MRRLLITAAIVLLGSVMIVAGIGEIVGPIVMIPVGVAIVLVGALAVDVKDPKIRGKR